MKLTPENSNQIVPDAVLIQDEISELSEKLRGKPWRIAIDGQAASGKGTVVDALSQNLSLEPIGSGNMYRAVTYYLLHFCQIENPEYCSDDELRRFLARISVELVSTDAGSKRVLLNAPQFSEALDVTDNLQDPEIGKIISKVTKRDPVRDKMESQQMTLFCQGKTIMEGRDMWTLVGPYADVLIYLHADDETLIEREMKRQSERGNIITVETAREIVLGRNTGDYQKIRGKLLTPEEAETSGVYDLVINTSELTPDMVTLLILKSLNIVASKSA